MEKNGEDKLKRQDDKWTGIRDCEVKEDATRCNKKEEEEMDRTCVERKWTFERSYRRKNGRKAPSRKKASNDVRLHERRERTLCWDERESTSQGKLDDLRA